MILPTHRAIRNLQGFDPEKILSSLDKAFEVRRCNTPEEVVADMKGTTHRFGLLLKNGFYVLSLRPRLLDQPSFMPELAGLARSLEVNILHEGILRPLLEIGPEELARQENVDYHREWKRAAWPFAGGDLPSCFLAEADHPGAGPADFRPGSKNAPKIDRFLSQTAERAGADENGNGALRSAVINAKIILTVVSVWFALGGGRSYWVRRSALIRSETSCCRRPWCGMHHCSR